MNFSADSVKQFLTLPGGRVLEDAFYYPDFVQNILGVDVNAAFANIREYPSWPDTEQIPFRPDGGDVHWIKGTHPSLSYRGHQLRRHKIWLQNDYNAGMLKYGYTGWQHSISFATHAIEKVPVVHDIAVRLNGVMKLWDLKPLNHFIVTTYDNENDNIGFHSDKAKDFEEDSYFVVLKLGAPRAFEFRMKRDEKQEKEKPFFSEVLRAGTAIFVRANGKDGLDANNIVQHGVPVSKTPCGPSGSIVARSIKTVVPWATVQKNIQAAAKAKANRLAAKKRKREGSNGMHQGAKK